MISLANDFTDTKGRHAKGWLFFDVGCLFCTRLARWLAPILALRGYGVAPLQDPRVAVLLAIPPQDLLRELRFLRPDATQCGGADAVLAVARLIWWARPLVWFSQVPGMSRQLHSAYRWVAAHRKCSATRCLATAPHP
jgi:predicted DCC family thiol-disulfide oxidoreductase YuxK